MSQFRYLHLHPGAVAIFAAVAVISASAIVTFANSGDVKPVKKKLTGEELYAVNCERCHSERYATERTKAEWNTIMIHMRVRANLPAAQAREILKYLQENCGTNP